MKKKFSKIIILNLIILLNTDLLVAQCSFTSITDTITPCNQIDNHFQLTGSVFFTNPPTTGLLTITNCNGDADTIYPPFVSPSYFALSLNSDGTQNCTLTAMFTDSSTCTISISNNYPSSCLCSADIGTFSANIFGNSQLNYKLCYNDTFRLISNGDMTPPNEATSPPITNLDPSAGYRPGIGYIVYSCPPNVVPQNDLLPDTCFVGIVAIGSSFTETNTLGEPNWPGNFSNNIVYYVPFTLYDTVSYYYSYSNTLTNCYSMGVPFAVQYLPEVVSTNPIEDGVNNSVTVSINGGLPSLDGSLFTASNLVPTTANFINTTTGNNGIIQINGLQNGDMYSFDVSDSNGCPITITGGPFVSFLHIHTDSSIIICADTLSYNLGAHVLVSGGFPPYNYQWETSHTIGANTYYASTFLNDSTSSNPQLINYLSNLDTLNFKLTVTDSLLNTAIDSIYIIFSQFSSLLIDNFSTINQGDSLQLTHTIGGGVPPYSYNWIPNYNLSDSSEEFPWAKPDTTTFYNCKVTDSGNCQSSNGDIFEVYVNPVGIQNYFDDLNLIMYPNPSKSAINISYTLTQNIQTAYLVITNSLGQVIYTTQLNASDNKTTIPTVNWEQGIYYYFIENNNERSATKKMIIVR